MENNSVMTTIALKKYLISKINLLEDDSILGEIKKIVDKNETVYILSDDQLNMLKEADEQMKNGDFVTQEDMDVKIEQWMKRK